MTGRHAQSAAAALHEAGAGEVTVVALARRLSPEYGPTRGFLESGGHLRGEYSVEICPFTGDACPQ